VTSSCRSVAEGGSPWGRDSIGRFGGNVDPKVVLFVSLHWEVTVGVTEVLAAGSCGSRCSVTLSGARRRVQVTW